MNLTSMLISLTGLALVGCSGPATIRDDAALLAHIERQIVMPEGAGPLNDYNRRYSREGHVYGDAGRGRITGLLLWFGDLPKDAAWEDGPVDLVMDGGCSVIYLTYDEASDVIESIRCNGEA